MKQQLPILYQYLEECLVYTDATSLQLHVKSVLDGCKEILCVQIHALFDVGETVDTSSQVLGHLARVHTLYTRLLKCSSKPVGQVTTQLKRSKGCPCLQMCPNPIFGCASIGLTSLSTTTQTSFHLFFKVKTNYDHWE